MTFSIYRKPEHHVPISQHQNVGEDGVELGWLIGWLIRYWGLQFVGRRRRKKKGDQDIGIYDKPFSNKV
jgi:hypothetical protein